MMPKLRFREFSDEWNLERFSDGIKLLRGSSPRPIVKYRTNDSDGVNWIKIGDTIAGSNIISDVGEKITLEGARKSRAVSKGDIILANSMSFGKSYLLHLDGYIYDGWFVLRDYEESYDRAFLLQLLNSDYMQRQYLRLSAGGVVQNISSEIVYSTQLPKPTIKEQQKVASLLEALDKKVNLLTKKKEALETYKKGLMQKIFSQELRFKREDGTDYPEWSPTPLKAILKERKTLSSDTDSIELVSLTKEGVVAKSDRYNRAFLVKDASKKYKMTLLNDICYNPANLKFGVICRNTFGKALFSPIYVTFEVNDHLAENSFIELFVTTQNFIQKALKYQEGTVYERMAVKPDDLVRSVIQLPCIDEQKRIVFLIEALAAKEEILRSTIESTKLLKKGLLQQMFV